MWREKNIFNNMTLLKININRTVDHANNESTINCNISKNFVDNLEPPMKILNFNLIHLIFEIIYSTVASRNEIVLNGKILKRVPVDSFYLLYSCSHHLNQNCCIRLVKWAEKMIQLENRKRRKLYILDTKLCWIV